MCDNLFVIPQNKGTCWFNVIITACCYSQELKKVVEKASINWNNNSFFNFMKTILKYSYINDNTLESIFVKNKIEYLLFKYLNLFDKKLKKNMQLSFKYDYQNPYFLGGHITYFIKFLRNLNIETLDIIILNNHYLINLTKYISLKYNIKKFNLNDYSPEIANYLIKKNMKYEFKISTILDKRIKKPDLSIIPQIIVIHLPHNNNYFGYITNDLLKHSSKDFHINYNNEYLEYKNCIYSLDCCLLSNYNIYNTEGHAILGLKCGNKKYIYNSHNYCKLYEFNWNINDDNPFSFNYKKCKLKYKFNEEKEQCFSFAKGNRLLIYVKNDNEYRSISNKSIMIDEFYNIKNLSKTDLSKIIKNLKLNYKNKTKKELIHLFNQYIHK